MQESSLELVCKKLFDRKIDNDQIFYHFKKHKDFSRSHKFPLHVYLNMWRDIELLMNLKNIRKENKDLKMDIFPRSFNEDYKIIHQYQGCGDVVNAIGQVSRFSNISKIDDYLVGFQFKLTKWNLHQGKDIRSALKPQKVANRLKPLLKISKNVSMVYIIPENVYFQKILDEQFTDFHQFLKNGFMIKPFHSNKKDYENNVRKYIRRRGLKLIYNN